MLSAYAKLQEVYTTGKIEVEGLSFANNFFLDRSRERWRAQLAAIKDAVGPCPSPKSLSPTWRLRGSFDWDRTHARVSGSIMMSPHNPDEVQLMHIRQVVVDRRRSEVITDFDFH
ncbi:MAG: hypothetical protein AAF225_12905 [Pseudomonadota bacterium]